MPVHEVSLFGLLVSPIFVMVIIAVVLTSFAAQAVDKIIPYSLQRNESLMSMLLFMVILAALVSFTF